MARVGGTPGNLIPIQKGEVRNPNGRPIGALNRSTILRKWADVRTQIVNPETKEIEAGTLEDKLALALWARAIDGDVQAIKEVLDSLYGKANQATDITTNGKDINTITISIVDD
jgi:hypothetical protein